MKKPAFILSVLLMAVNLSAQVILETFGGWFETAFVTWQPTEGAEKYNVYIAGEGLPGQQIDDYLIRSYGVLYRADIPGLSPGMYAIRVAPVFSGSEGMSIETDSIEVLTHDRSGFAFSGDRVPGGYKLDGTPKDGAVILYITEQNKDTISMEVTGANENPCVGLQEILDGFKKGKDNRPLIIRMIGQVTDLAFMYKGDIVIENKNNLMSHITLEGIGDDAVADGWGLRVKNATNIEIRNIGFMNCNSDEGDNIGLQQNNTHIWVHHCDLFYGHAGNDADQAKGDGALDCKRSGNVTIAYNHFWDTGKSLLLGNGVEDPQFLTYHHNWFDHSDSRHPRVRSHSVHVYNNYYDGNAKYGVGSTNASSVFVENNYFRNCAYPMMISMQGSDVYDESQGSNDYEDMPTFSKEDGGMIKAFGNVISGQKRFVAWGDSDFPVPTVDFDAYVVMDRNDTIASSVKSFMGGNTYNNFDVDQGIMYPYEPDSPESAMENTIDYSGRVNGGDFQWTFDNAVDDASYEVNAPLKAALTGYRTKLVYIQAEQQMGLTAADRITDQNMVIYPNPVYDLVNLSMPHIIREITVYSASGVKVMAAGQGVDTLDFGRLPAGLYRLLIRTHGGIINKSLVKL